MKQVVTVFLISIFYLTLYTLTSVCIFSILISIQFLRHWQEEFVQASGASLVGDRFLYSWDPNLWLPENIVTNDEMLVPLWGQRENKIILLTNLTPYVSQGVQSHIGNSLLTSFNQLKVYLNCSFGSIKQCKWLYLMHFTYTEISGKSFSENVSVQTVCIFIIFDSTVFTTAPTTWAFCRHHYVDIC